MINIKFINATSVQLKDQDDNTVQNVGEFVSPTEYYFEGNTFSSSDQDYYHFVIEGEDVELSGVIGEVTKDFQYFNLFKGQTAITKAEDLTLSSTVVKKFCYANMFLDCTNLTSPPTIGATTLDQWCYSSMFGNCSSLSSVPVLPATTLARYCYYCMFYGCKSLSSAPYLSAQTLEDWCYNSMFYECKNLTSISADFTAWGETATTNWVTGIDTKGNFYNNNVAEIYGVDNVPQTWKPDMKELALTFESVNEYSSRIWIDQVNLSYKVNNGEWQAYTPNYQVQIPVGGKASFSGTNSIITANFKQRINTTYMPAGRVKVYGNAHSLINWGEMTTNNCFAKLFKDCVVLVDASELVLSSNTLTRGCYDGMFEGCSSLTSVPRLPAMDLARECYQGMFNNCTSLVSVPKDLLPAQLTSKGDKGYASYCYMFAYCTSLQNAPDLPSLSTWIDCYNQMFTNCPSLKDAPYLPATKLYSNCYKWMFTNCTSLTGVSVGFTDWNKTWVEWQQQYRPASTQGWLYNVGLSGMFAQPTALAEERGVDYVPQSWTIINKQEGDN